MKDFVSWFKEKSGEEVPDVHNGKWYIDRDLPMIVSCTCCESTLLLAGAYLDDEGYIYCPSCKGEN